MVWLGLLLLPVAGVVLWRVSKRGASAASSRSTAVWTLILACAVGILVLPLIALVPVLLAGLTEALGVPVTWLGLLLLPLAVAGVVLWRASRPGTSAAPRSGCLRALAFIALPILAVLVAMIIAVRLAYSYAPQHGAAASVPRWHGGRPATRC